MELDKKVNLKWNELVKSVGITMKSKLTLEREYTVKPIFQKFKY